MTDPLWADVEPGGGLDVELVPFDTPPPAPPTQASIDERRAELEERIAAQRIVVDRLGDLLDDEVRELDALLAQQRAATT